MLGEKPVKTLSVARGCVTDVRRFFFTLGERRFNVTRQAREKHRINKEMKYNRWVTMNR